MSFLLGQRWRWNIILITCCMLKIDFSSIFGCLQSIYVSYAVFKSNISKDKFIKKYKNQSVWYFDNVIIIMIMTIMMYSTSSTRSFPMSYVFEKLQSLLLLNQMITWTMLHSCSWTVVHWSSCTTPHSCSVTVLHSLSFTLLHFLSDSSEQSSLSTVSQTCSNVSLHSVSFTVLHSSSSVTEHTVSSTKINNYWQTSTTNNQSSDGFIRFFL